MKFALLALFAALLFAASVWFFFRSGGLLVLEISLAGALHVIPGLALSKVGLDFARLAVLTRIPR